MVFALPQSPLAPAMHIPDGFLSIGVSLIFWAISIVFIILAARNIQSDFDERQVPLMGVLAAFIFAAQMINFPVTGGTSGHMLGGALAGIVLGPWAGILVMTAVISLQGLLFQDGGLLVMGANIFNMGILTVLIGFGMYRAVLGRGRGAKLATAGVAAWLSVMAAALLTSLELWLSGTTALTVVVPAMLAIHALIGVGEALITVAALSLIMQTRPRLLADEEVGAHGGLGWTLGGLAAALAVVLLAPFASVSPDGLERVATNLGFLDAGERAPFTLLPGYTIPFLGNTGFSTVIAGLIGALIVAGLVVLLARALRKASAKAT